MLSHVLSHVLSIADLSAVADLSAELSVKLLSGGRSLGDGALGGGVSLGGDGISSLLRGRSFEGGESLGGDWISLGGDRISRRRETGFLLFSEANLLKVELSMEANLSAETGSLSEGVSLLTHIFSCSMPCWQAGSIR